MRLMTSSARTSASVTGDASAFVVTARFFWYRERMISAAACAACSAAWSSCDAAIMGPEPVWLLPARWEEETSMGNRLSKIYTRTGDDGTTGLGDGSRVAKESARVEAYGTVDELNSTVGVLLAAPGLPDAVVQCLTEVQHELFDMGGELCIPGHRVITD